MAGFWKRADRLAHRHMGVLPIWLLDHVCDRYRRELRRAATDA